MNDDEVLNAVKKTLSDVRMDRPVEAIEQRGRDRRRNRGLLMGGALAAVAATAVAVPLAVSASGPAPAGDTAVAQPAPDFERVGFTLTKQGDSVELALNPRKTILNPDDLQKKLAGAGVPAIVKADVMCTPRVAELPQKRKVLTIKSAQAEDPSNVNAFDIVINTRAMPKGSELHFSVFSTTEGGDYNRYFIWLLPKGADVFCKKYPF